MPEHLRRAEATAAALLTLAAVWLHSVTARSAGALWRDEANTVGLATLPALGDVWKNLQYDSFPILWILIVRASAALFGPMNDTAFRAIGLLIGLSVVAALWFVARTFGNRVPLVSLALLAVSPSVIRWGDSLRAYGLGIALTLTTCALIWRFVMNANRRTFALASLVAVLSVQTLYYNAPGLMAFCAGAVAVCAMRREWKKAGWVTAIGGLAALSLLPYLATIRGASSWNSLVQIPNYDMAWFFIKLDQTLSPAGPWATAVWIGAFVLALFAGSREALAPHRLGLSSRQREAAVFGLVALAIGVLTQMSFLFFLSYLTQPWYYLTLLAVGAVCIDIVAGALVVTPIARGLRMAAVVAIGVLSVFSAGGALDRRMTNADVVASLLEKRAAQGDLIVVSQWYTGVSFGRYYRGSAEWTMLPAFGFHRFHRYDLLQAAMIERDQRSPAEPVIRKAESVLRAGNSVFIVGGLPPSRGSPSRLLPPVRLPQEGWRSMEYQIQWASLFATHLRLHATGYSPIPTGEASRINEYEDLPLAVATGWRE